MVRDVSTAGEVASPWPGPWQVLAAGLAGELAGWLWSVALAAFWPPGRGLLAGAGLVALGSAVALRLARAAPRAEDRLASAALLALAALGAGLASLALDPPWDSLGLLARLLALAAVGGALLAALPWRARLAALSALILFHFAAVLTAVLTVPPPNAPPPWLASQLWTRVFRPYLLLTNLNNGYHFYSPEPGPMTLLWFRVSYADGTSRWLRLPDHRTSRNHLETRRAGALAVSLAQAGEVVPPDRYQQIAERRRRADVPLARMPEERQFRPPGPGARMLLRSYVRRVARTTPHPDDPGRPVTAVKAYLVEYSNAPVSEFQAGGDPLDPALYFPYFLGEFDAEGELQTPADDPLLYWLIPILREPVGEPPPPAPGARPTPPRTRLVNYLRIHAGDGDEEGVP
jgi:hypothetical protein